MITAFKKLTGARVPGLKISVAAATAALAVIALAVGPVAAAVLPSYSNIPAAIPGNVPSVGYEATSTSEFGDLIAFEAGSTRARASLPVTVVMSIWACETGGYATCQTTPGDTWSQPLTLKIYAADESGAVPAVGAQLVSTTQTFDLPYRPSYDPAGPCAAISSTGWYSATANACYNGLAHPVTFTLPAGADLPDRIVWTISYNTSHHGYSPVGTNGPWDSLNLGVKTFSGEPSRGTDVDLTSAFMNSTWSGAYEDGGAAGTGSLRYDVGGWSGYAPLACIGLNCDVQDPLATPTASPIATGTPVATASPSSTPFESFAGETATPIVSVDPTEIIGGATATPQSATPPPTSTSGSGNGGASTLLALSICAAFAVLGLMAVASQKRAMRR